MRVTPSASHSPTCSRNATHHSADTWFGNFGNSFFAPGCVGICSKFLTRTTRARKDEKPQEKELQWWVKKGQCRLGVTRSQLAACPTLIHAAGNYKGERIVMDPKPAILHKVSENGRIPSQPSTCMVRVLWDSRTLIFAVLAALGLLIKVAGDG